MPGDKWNDKHKCRPTASSARCIASENSLIYFTTAAWEEPEEWAVQCRMPAPHNTGAELFIKYLYINLGLL